VPLASYLIDEYVSDVVEGEGEGEGVGVGVVGCK